MAATAQPLVPATTADGRTVLLRARYVPASEFVPETAEANATAALPPLPVVYQRTVVQPVPVPVADAPTWGGGWNGGYRGGWGCRSRGPGALVGTVAGAVIGYGLADPWNRSTGTVIGGLVGGLAGSAIERSSRC